MPVTQQAPGYPCDAEFLGGRAQDLFEQVVCPKRPRPTRVQKDPAAFLGLRAQPVELFTFLAASVRPSGPSSAITCLTVMYMCISS